MPAFNAENHVADCLEALLSQTHQALEVLVGDDGSDDATRELVDRVRDDRMRVFHGQENVGPAVFRNHLLAHARSEFVAFQDADDVSAPERIQRQLAFLEANPGVGFCGTFVRRLSMHGRDLGVQTKPVTDPEIRNHLHAGLPFCHATLMYRTALVSRLGGFRGFFNRIGAEDFDLALRALEQAPAANVPEVLYFYRSVPSSFSRTHHDERQLVSTEFARRLADQRRIAGVDSLMTGEHQEVARILDLLLAPHRSAPSLRHRQRAGALLADGDSMGAFASCLAALRVEPGNLENYRALGYCLRTVARHSFLSNVWERCRR